MRNLHLQLAVSVLGFTAGGLLIGLTIALVSDLVNQWNGPVGNWKPVGRTFTATNSSTTIEWENLA